MKDLGYQPTSAYEGWNLPLISQEQEASVQAGTGGEHTILPCWRKDGMRESQVGKDLPDHRAQASVWPTEFHL